MGSGTPCGLRLALSGEKWMQSLSSGTATRKAPFGPAADRLPWPVATLAIGALSLLAWAAVGMLARLLFG